MKEADLFRAYGMDHNDPIPETRKCSTPKCHGEVLFLSGQIFCRYCKLRMIKWEPIKEKRPDG